MSSDLVAIVVEDGQARAWWSRWGALSLARDLLQGPAAFTAYVATLDPLAPIRLVPWLCGLAVIDRDARTLGVWGEAAGLWRSALHALCRARWPGWQVTPLVDLRDLPGAVLRPLAPLAVDEVVAAQARIWTTEGTHEDVRAWAATAGDAEVREALEWGEHALWLTVRDDDGTERHDTWTDRGVDGQALTIGLAGVRAVLATRPAGGAPVPWDGRFRLGALVDVAARTLSLWQKAPCYPDDLLGALAVAWPGWSIVAWPDQGAHLAAVGLAPTRGWGPDTQRDLDAALARTLGERETGPAVLARATAHMTLAPGERLVVTDPGSSVGPAEQEVRTLVDELARWCAAHAPRTDDERVDWPPPTP